MANFDELAAQFDDGDVLYGLDVPRAAARSAILRSGKSRTTPVTKMILCCIPYTKGTTTNVLIQNDLTNAVWDSQNPTTYSSDKAIGKTLTDGTRGSDFKAFLSNHTKYNVAEQFQNGTLTDGDPTDTRKAWGRTSKAGLEFQTRSGGTVHFIITDLNFNDIATKTGYGGKGNITSAELRWLYRHRDADEVKNRVRFWVADREVPHNEVWSDSSWASYHPKHEVSNFGTANTLRTALNVSWI